LVNTRRWPSSLGADFSELYKLREVADYGVLHHASPEDAAGAVERAERIVKAVHDMRPDLFDLDLPTDESIET